MESITVTNHHKSALNKKWLELYNMGHRRMMDSVMKELMRGIRIGAGPINQQNCSCNHSGAIGTTTSRCTGTKGGGGEERE